MFKVRIEDFLVLILLVLSTVVPCTDCCSSRTIQAFKDLRGMQTQNDDGHSGNPSELVAGDTNGTPASSAYDEDDATIIVNDYHNDRLVNSDDFDPIDSIISAECTPLFDLYYCLNGGRCFNYTIGNSNFPVCECPESYGERCEFKYVVVNDKKNYPKISTANIYLGSFIVGVFGSLAVFVCCFRI